MVVPPGKAGWRCATETPGAPYATPPGTVAMPGRCAGSSTFLPQVCQSDMCSLPFITGCIGTSFRIGSGIVSAIETSTIQVFFL